MGCKNAGRWLRPPKIVRKTTAHEPISNQKTGQFASANPLCIIFSSLFFFERMPENSKEKRVQKAHEFPLYPFIKTDA